MDNIRKKIVSNWAKEKDAKENPADELPGNSDTDSLPDLDDDKIGYAVGTNNTHPRDLTRNKSCFSLISSSSESDSETNGNDLLNLTDSACENVVPSTKTIAIRPKKLLSSQSDNSSKCTLRTPLVETNEETLASVETACILANENSSRNEPILDCEDILKSNLPQNDAPKDSNVFTLSGHEWSEIAPPDSFSKGPRRLVGYWTAVFTKNLRNICPSCVFIFKGNQVKCQGSRKMRAPFFRGKASCKRDGCSCKVVLEIKEEPTECFPVQVVVMVSGTVLHTETHQRTQLRGKERKDVARDAQAIGVSNFYYNKLACTSENSINTRNFTDIPAPNVIRKAVAEHLDKERLHRDFIQEVVLLMEAYRDDDENPRSQYAGYIQYIAVSPFTVIMFCDRQISLMVRLFNEEGLDLYLDATGKVIRQIPDQKRPYLYSMVVKPAQSPPISIADMLTTDHTIPSVTHFLLFVRRALITKKPNCKPRKVETDWSYALIQSVLHAFSNMDVKAYLNTAMEICCAGKHTDITVIHICCAHMIKTFSNALRKLTRKNKDLHRFVMKCFVVLLNQTCPQNSKEIFECICRVLLRETETPKVTYAVERILKRHEMLGKEDVCLENFTDICCSSDDNYIDETAENKTTIKAASPWTSYFQNIRNNVAECKDEETSVSLNKYLCPLALDLLLDRFMPIYPLWSGILLRDLNRYRQGSAVQNICEQAETRDSNACVESWFKAVKVDILRNTQRHRPAQLISKMKKSINGRLREADNPYLRQMRKQKRSPVVDEAREKWHRGRKRRTNMYQPVKQSKISKEHNKTKSEMCKSPMLDSVTKFPAVPKWGGCVSGISLANTCTIDNFLTIMHIAAIDFPAFVDVCRNASDDRAFDCLVKCLTLMKQHMFVEAKLAWVTHIKGEVSGSVDLYGSEYDMFASYFQNLVKCDIVSVCSSECCPEKTKQKIVKGCFLSSSGKPTIKAMVEGWQKPNAVKCTAQPSEKMRREMPKSAFRCETAEDVDKEISINIHICAGQRRVKRNINGLPPVLVLTVSDLVQLNKLSSDVTEYCESVIIDGRQFILVGVTLYKHPSHFVCCIKSRKYGWLFYDGLDGKVANINFDSLKSCIPQNVVYISL